MEAFVAWLGGADAVTRLVLVGALVAVRAAPLAWVAPWLAVRQAPATLRGGVLVALTAALLPTALEAAPALPSDALSLAILAIRELSIGLVFAVVTAAPLLALGEAGRIADALRGAGGAEIDGLAGATTPLGQLQLALGASVFLAVGGHLVVIEALGRGVASVPPGSPLHTASLAAFFLGAARLATDALTIAASIAAPVAVGLIGVEVAIGLAARAGPALPVQALAVPIRTALGLALVLLSLAVAMPRVPALTAAAARAAVEATESLAPRR